MVPLLKLANRFGHPAPCSTRTGSPWKKSSDGYENAAGTRRPIELNPVVPEFQKVIVRKWQRTPRPQARGDGERRTADLPMPEISRDAVGRPRLFEATLP